LTLFVHWLSCPAPR